MDTNIEKLIKSPIIYDIIIGDFGRDATIEYLRFIAKYEHQSIEKILNDSQITFYDEYRKIMFSAVCELSYFKENVIKECIKNNTILSNDVLFAVADNPMTSDFIERVTLRILQEISQAIDRGYVKIRLITPCNSLSTLTNLIKRSIESGNYKKNVHYKEIFKNIETYRNIEFCTIPQKVITYLLLLY